MSLQVYAPAVQEATCARAAAFRSRYHAGEVTAKINNLPKPDSRPTTSRNEPVECLAQARTEGEVLLAQMLVETGFTSLSDINTAIQVATINNYSLLEIASIFFLLTPRLCQCFNELIMKIQDGLLTFNQAVTAAKRVCMTGETVENLVAGF